MINSRNFSERFLLNFFGWSFDIHGRIKMTGQFLRFKFTVKSALIIYKGPNTTRRQIKVENIAAFIINHLFRKNKLNHNLNYFLLNFDFYTIIFSTSYSTDI